MVELKVGQRYRVTSIIAQEYEKELKCQFAFISEIISLEPHSFAPYWPAERDLQWKLVDWGNHPYGQDVWYASHCILHGHDRYDKFTDNRQNYSPDIIAGAGDWYVPNLFRWQSWFLWLIWHDVVELIN